MTTISDERLDVAALYDRWHAAFSKAFITQVSEGGAVGQPPKDLYIKIAFRSFDELHESYAAMAALADPSVKEALRAQGGVGVKALEWNDDGTARSSLGDLYDVASLGGSVWQVRWNGTAFTGWHSSREDARASAQADYERRILSSLEASPAPVSEEITDPSFPGALSDNEVRIWINACNHEPARQALRQLLAYRVRGITAALAAKGAVPEPAPVSEPLTLDEEELDTILAIGRNEQSGRVTNYELKELVRVYRAALAAKGGQ